MTFPPHPTPRPVVQPQAQVRVGQGVADVQDHSAQGPGTSPGPGIEGVLVGDLATAVFDNLLDRIIGGSLVAGDRVPSERSLTEQFGVNRQVVREAVKRLTLLGLVVADRGNGTRVQDWRRTGSFDLLPLLVARALGNRGPEPMLTAQHLLEMRLAFALSVTQLSIVHAGDDQMDQLVAAALEVASFPDVTQRFAAEWRTWSIAAEGSGNIALVLMLNSLRAAAGPSLLLMARASGTVPGDPDELVVAARAVAARDLPAAEAAVRHLYRIEPTPELRAAQEQVGGDRLAEGRVAARG